MYMLLRMEYLHSLVLEPRIDILFAMSHDLRVEAFMTMSTSDRTRTIDALTPEQVHGNAA